MSERLGMRPTTLMGILVVAGIGIGAMLSSILPDLPGWGSGSNLGMPGGDTAKTGSDPQDKQEKTATSQVESKAPPAVSPSHTEVHPIGNEPDASGTTDQAEYEPQPTVYVVVNGRDYLLRKGPEDRSSQKPATLQDVVAAAKLATGDENGVRVRIFETKTARTTATNALLDHLAEANIPRDVIRHRDEPLNE